MVEEVTDPEDGLISFRLQPQTEKKLTRIRHMMTAVNYIVAKNSPYPRHYVDMFSGTGKYVNDKGQSCIGSPIISMNIPKPFSVFHFTELEKKYFEPLKARALRVAKEKEIPNESIKIMNGDANELADEILSQINETEPCFAFLDPFGLELKWDTVIKFLKRKRIDLVINFSISGVLRNADISRNESTLDGYFGDHSWKEMLEKAPKSDSDHAIKQRRDLLTNFYLEKIKKHKPEATPSLLRTETGSPLYYLIYVSPFTVGSKIWKQITGTKEFKTLDGSICEDYDY